MSLPTRPASRAPRPQTRPAAQPVYLRTTAVRGNTRSCPRGVCWCGSHRSWPIGEFRLAIQPSARAAARSPLPGGNVWSWAAARAVIEGIMRAPDDLLMRTAVQPLSPGPELVDEAAEDIGLRCLLIARPVQTPAPQRGGRVDLHHGADTGTIDGVPRSVEAREQDCASQCDVRDLVSRDAQRRDAQFVVYEGVGPAHGQLLPPSSAGLAAGQAGMAGVMGGHEMDERVRPAERAVDPGLAGPVDHAHDGVIVDPAADVPDDCAGACPLDGGQSRSFRSCGQINPRGYHRHRLLR